jgi:hypothetical protein
MGDIPVLGDYDGDDKNGSTGLSKFPPDVVLRGIGFCEVGAVSTRFGRILNKKESYVEAYRCLDDSCWSSVVPWTAC